MVWGRLVQFCAVFLNLCWVSHKHTDDSELDKEQFWIGLDLSGFVRHSDIVFFVESIHLLKLVSLKIWIHKIISPNQNQIKLYPEQ